MKASKLIAKIKTKKMNVSDTWYFVCVFERLRITTEMNYISVNNRFHNSKTSAICLGLFNIYF